MNVPIVYKETFLVWINFFGRRSRKSKITHKKIIEKNEEMASFVELEFFYGGHMCQFSISSKTWVCPDPESTKSLDPEPDSLKKGSETQLLCAFVDCA
jgi:hypothetical protein